MRNRAVSFKLEPDFRSVDKVRQAIDLELSDWFGEGVDDAVIADFCQVICELVNNAVEHGGCTFIEAKLLLESRVARFVLVTDGTCFDTAASTAHMPEVDAEGDLPEGGFGLSIIRTLSDGVSYCFREGRNVTEISKNFREVGDGTQD